MGGQAWKVCSLRWAEGEDRGRPDEVQSRQEQVRQGRGQSRVRTCQEELGRQRLGQVVGRNEAGARSSTLKGSARSAARRHRGGRCLLRSSPSWHEAFLRAVEILPPERVGTGHAQPGGSGSLTLSSLAMYHRLAPTK